MVFQHLNRNNTVCFYYFNSLNRFDDRAPYSLPNTPLYTLQTDSWKNIRAIRQTELDCGMQVCMAASLIAQHKGTFQSSINKCKDIINMSNFSSQYVVNILTTKQCIEVKQ
jgi:hypothetical protein